MKFEKDGIVIQIGVEEIREHVSKSKSPSTSVLRYTVLLTELDDARTALRRIVEVGEDTDEPNSVRIAKTALKIK